jgi:transposase
LEPPVRASTLLNALLELPGVRATGAAVVDGELRVTVALRARQLACPRCSLTTRHRYDTRGVDSSWRHLDMGGRVCRLVMRRRRLRCPEHGVLAEAVPFARDRSGHTRDFEDLVAWLATKTDKTTISAFARISWRTVGAICQRVVADVLDADRWCGLVDIGVDEISWRKHHRYLTLVSNHDTGKIIWGKPGKDTDTLNAFFDALPNRPLRASRQCRWTWDRPMPKLSGATHLAR